MTYTPTTDHVRGSYADGQWYARHRMDGTVDEFDRWLAEYTRQQREEAWREGHKTPHRRGPDKCRCEAWSRSECACGRYGKGKLISLKDNPYREDTP